MAEILSIATAIIVSLGGGGFIVLGLSSWIGKMWAYKLIEEERSKQEKSIVEYRSMLDKELKRFDLANEKILHTTKAQYDKELDIYFQIWESLFKCTQSTLALYSSFERIPVDGGLKRKHFEEKYMAHVKDLNSYGSAVTKYAPFYKESLYQKFRELWVLCRNLGFNFEDDNLVHIYSDFDTDFPKNPIKEVYISKPKEIEGKRDLIMKEIRNHLGSLRVE